jgi:hypothetical protein
MSISHWGIFPGILYECRGVKRWRPLSFCFWVVLSSLSLLLGGCLTTEEAFYINRNFDRVPTREEILARDAEIACKSMARNLVQIARCEVRR